MSDDNENNSQNNTPKRKGAGRPKGSKDTTPRKRMSTIKASGTRKYISLTPNKKNKFLRYLEQTGNVNSAAAQVGVTRQAIYALAKRNPAFNEKMEIARGKATGMLEEEAIRRAKDGVEKKIYYKGEEIGTERQYSDGLLTKLLEASDPGRYGKKSYNYSEQNINISGETSAKEKLASLLGVSLDEAIDGEFEEVDDK